MTGSKKSVVRKLAENFFSLLALEGFNYLFPFITLPYLTSVLGAENYGRVVFARSLTLFFVGIVGYGFVFSSTREIARNRKNAEKLNYVFSSTFYASLCLAFLCFAVLIALVLFGERFREEWLLYVVSFGMVFDALLLPQWFFQGVERMKYITVLSVSSKFVFVLLMFLLIRSPSDYILVPVLTSTGFLLSGVLGYLFIWKHFHVRLVLVPVSEVYMRLRHGFALFLTSFVPTLYNNASTFLLGLTMPDKSLLAYYAAAVKVVDMPNAGMRVLSRTIYPHLCKNSSRFCYFHVALMIAGLLASLLLFFVAPPIVNWLLPSEFSASIEVIRLLSPCPFFLSLAYAHGTNWLVVHGFDKAYMAITTSVSLLGLLSAFYLIPKLQDIGAGYVLLSSRALLGVSSTGAALGILSRMKRSRPAI